MARQTKDINKDVVALVRQIQRLIPLLEAQVLTGLMDDGNSTDETLGAGGAFTGDWVLVSDRVQAAISISVTAASAADGLVFEHSADGVTPIHSHSYALQAGESRHFDEPLLLDYFRVVYTDGGAGGDLVLQTKLYKSAPTAHAHALSELFNDEHGANIVRSVLAGFDVVGGLSKNVNSYEVAAGIVALLSLLVDPTGAALRFYTEDGVKAGNAVGIAPMGIRRDTLVALTPADGDWTPWYTNDKGALWVALDGSLSISGTVTIAGTVTADAGSGWAASGLATEVTLAAISAKLPASLGQKAMAASLAVVIASDQSAVPVSGSVTGAVAGTTAHDAPGAGVNPVAIGGYASATAPANVSATTDIVRAWHLLNGARATVITAAGALIGGDAANGLDVDVTRMAALVAGSAIIGKVGIDQTTPGTTNAVAPIAGQAGVQGGSGAVTALTQRVVLANDVGLPAGASNIGDVDIASTPESEAVYKTGTKSAGSAEINGSGGSWVELVAAPTNPWKKLSLYNSTDQDLEFSFDGGTTVHKRLLYGTCETIDYKKNELKESSAVHVRSAATAAPTVGKAVANGETA